MSAQIKDITGKRFGKLVVLGISHRIKKYKIFWLCKCDCGNVKAMVGVSLKSGIYKSCGCARYPKRKYPRDSFYTKWMSMRNRCNNPNNTHYKRYGGRGIKVCERWNDYNVFHEDMVPSYKKSLTLERINNDGNYEPSNCKWATTKEQARNTSRNAFYTIGGITKCFTEWCLGFSMNQTTVRARIKRGMTIEEALTAPVGSPSISYEEAYSFHPESTNESQKL